MLDSSALLAYIENEDGVAEIEQVFVEALDGLHTLHISVISCIEVYYISLREQGEVVADERLELLNDLPLFQMPLDESGITPIGKLKVSHSMSFADCCIAGLALQKQAILMHKDPEFEQLKDKISLHALPYKTNPK